MLDSLYGNEWFTTLDLFSAYHHIPIASSDRHKTAFIVLSAPEFLGRLFQFNRMCFGLTNAPATFCRLIDRIFQEMKKRFCLVYVDDFFVYSRFFGKHLAHDEQILSKLQIFQAKKCAFGKSCVKFLGHEVSKDGVAQTKKNYEQS